MAFVTPRMSLKVWNSSSDRYDHEQLAENFLKLDQHDHAQGRGVPIPGAGIQPGAITADHIYPGALDGALTEISNDKLSGSEALGLNTSAVSRRGKSVIAATETRTNTAYGLMTTPDRVQNLVLPADGLIIVGYKAIWQESVLNAAKAAIFVGANQLKAPTNGAVPQPQEVGIGGGLPAIDVSLATTFIGIDSEQAVSVSTGADVTTGQVLRANSTRGGVTYIFAAAGTYDISVQFKASSGSVTVKDRKLWVWTVGF